MNQALIDFTEFVESTSLVSKRFANRFVVQQVSAISKVN
jgi:hypothetical protein